MAKYDRTIAYYSADFPRTLFPLDTNKIVIEHAAEALGDFIYESITHESSAEQTFASQSRAYAAKPNYQLRRTLKLDPVAEFFLYDITFRHRAAFRKSKSGRRKNFGYRFSRGTMISPAQSYQEFRSDVDQALNSYSACIKSDIAQYFNSLYHHDIVAWFRDYAKTDEDAELFGKFLRQINAGRSVDCLPHGLYPAKIIGSQFLKFVDDSNRFNASLMLRFMDDIYLFDDDGDVLLEDFYVLQRLLGEKGLTLNAEKTEIGLIRELNIRGTVDEMKSELLERRGRVVFGSGLDESDYEDEDEDATDEDGDSPGVLSEEEVEYLLMLLRAEHLEEEDAELILALMRDHTDDVMEYVPSLLSAFPGLSKSFYYFAEHIEDREALASFVYEFLDESPFVSEFQLFWLAKVAESYLLKSRRAGDLLSGLFEHRSATAISKAKILEIPEMRFGMQDLREEELRTGASGWLGWSAAVGSRKVKRANRNHLLGYFANGSPINELVARCVKRL